jgi:uncharacterized protein (TIGR02058 family)
MGPNVFDGAKTRTPKGFQKVVAVNTAALGIELHGQDDTAAAVKAVRQVFETISVPSVIDMVPGGIDKARAKVKVAVPYPDGVDKSQLEAIVPFKHVEIKVVKGGFTWNSGIVLPSMGDATVADPEASSDDEMEVTAPDQYKVAVAAARIGY